MTRACRRGNKLLDSVARHARAACAIVALLACDQSFEPIAESDRLFSVFGHLDASADTQWIRVMPIRPVILIAREPLGLAVTLEELGSGRVLTVRDSLMEYPYPYDEATGADAAFVHNFWTTDRIVPGETYRFTATGPDGASATATLPVPKDYSVTVAIRQGAPIFGLRVFDEVRIEGVDHLAFVRVHAHVRIPFMPPPAPPECDGRVHLQEIRYDGAEDSADPHVVRISKAFGIPMDSECMQQIAEQRDLWIVGTGSPWPRDFVTSRPWHASRAAFGVPELPTNLTNAVGFVGGVLTKTVPYEDCEIVGAPPIPQYCVLNYEESKANLTGTVFDACGNRPLADASVRLEEIDADPAGHRRIRTSPTGLLGGYRIAALDAGARYERTVRHPHPRHMPPPEGEEFPEYIVHTDTLVFATGEHATLDITLQRESVCDPD